MLGIGLVESRLHLLTCFGGLSQITWWKTTFPLIKERFGLAENFTKCLLSFPSVFFIMLTSYKTNLIAASAGKNKSSVRRLTNAGKYYSILPVIMFLIISISIFFVGVCE